MQEGYLRAPKICEFREEGRWFFLKSRTGEGKYPRPENLVATGKTKFEKGELVCAAYATTSPIYKLNAMVKLVKARITSGVKYFEKDDVIVSDCYAYESGIIKYVETKDGDIEVWIGSQQYEYNPRCMYYFPDGSEIKKFQRFCSGVVNMSRVGSDLSNINDVYLIFRKQFYTLIDPGYLSSNLSSLNTSQEELVELLFTTLMSKKVDEKSLKLKDLEYKGTHGSILNKNSFYTMLSYGYSANVIDKAVKGNLNLNGDLMTDTILGLLLNNKLDEK